MWWRNSDQNNRQLIMSPLHQQGDAQDFGDLFGSARTIAGWLEEIRGGLDLVEQQHHQLIIQFSYVTIASTGNGQDFGDCTKQNGRHCSGFHLRLGQFLPEEDTATNVAYQYN